MKKLAVLLLALALCSCEKELFTKEDPIECGECMEIVDYTIYHYQNGMVDSWMEIRMLYLCGKSYRDTTYIETTESGVNFMHYMTKNYSLTKMPKE
jgi:hypothetical protein